MKKIVSLILAAFLLTPAARAEVREGKWAMTVTTRMAGMDAQMAEANAAMANMSPEEKAMMQRMMGGMSVGMGAGGMTTSVTRCITNNDPVPQVNDAQKCQTTHSMRGNTIHFQSVCPEGTSTGDITYEQDSMQGTIQSNTNGQNATIELSGQYLGPCE